MRKAGGIWYSMFMGKNKRQLIPVEKSKRVIYLYRRGAEKKHKPIAAVFFGVLGFFCLCYFVYQLFFVSAGSDFYIIWGMMAGGCAILTFFLAHRSWVRRIPKWLRGCVTFLFIIGVLWFAVTEGLIISRFGAVPDPGADVCIILGAQMKESGPSDVLQRRLDKAVGYLQENPDTLVIVSGGRGSNEPVSEAQGMQEYLIAQGIAPERILMEDASANTRENLDFSAGLIDKGSDRVVIVTNNFHVFRAVSIAKKQGYINVQGLAADTHPGSLPNNMLREFLGVAKDFFMGNM